MLFGASNLATQWYGVRLVTGAFWAWKTKNVFKESIFRKKQNPNWLIIANVPYSHVDITFNTVEDLQLLLQYISKYIDDTNDLDTLKKDTYRPLLLIVDEAHVYFFSRNFKWNMNQDSIITNTQCRKRNIMINYITQDLAQLDVFMRRLCPNVTFYRRYFFFFTIALNLYYKVAEATDIGDEYSVEIESRYFVRPDRLQKKLHPIIRPFFEQKYLTKYVIWYTRSFTLSYKDFFWLLTNTNDLTILPKSKKSDQFFDSVSRYEKHIPTITRFFRYIKRYL